MDISPTFESPELRLVRRSRWLLTLAASSMLVAIADLVLDGPTSHSEFTLLAVAIASYAWRSHAWPRITHVAARADADGLQLGAHHVPRAEIREGFMLPLNPPRVKLRRRLRPSIELEFVNIDEGRALLRALGLGAGQTVVVFRALSRALARKRHTALVLGLFFAFYAGVAVWMNTHGPAAQNTSELLAVLGLVAMAAVFLAPTRLSVGADGIAMSWFGGERFIPFGDVVGVSRYGREWRTGEGMHFVGVMLALRSGGNVPIPTGQAKPNEEGSFIVEERIREALDTHRRGGLATDAAVLRRGHRQMADWVSALRALGMGANADMRTAPVPHERLFRVVEDPAATATARAAAAVALGCDLDDEGRARLRSAAAAVAGPRLRAAIETAARRVETAALEAALVEVEQEEATARAQMGA